MNRRRSLNAVASIVVVLSLAVACASNQQPPRTITVTGSAQVIAQPDIALVTFGYWRKDQDPNKAILDSKSTLAQAIAQLAALGVAQTDLQPLPVTMSTEAIIGPDGYPTDRLLYGINQTVNVTLRDVDNMGPVLDVLRQVAGAPYVYGLGVNFELSAARRAEVLAEAQANALAEARANAERLAQSLGATLGPALAAEVMEQPLTANPNLQAQVTVRISYRID